MIDQHASHQARRHGEEVGAVRPGDVHVDQPHVRLVDQRRPLERVVRSLRSQVALCQNALLVVDQWHQAVEGLLAAAPPLEQELRHRLFRGVVHRSPRSPATHGRGCRSILPQTGLPRMFPGIVAAMDRTTASGDRLCVRYTLACGDGESADEKVAGIALEQTVELPRGCVSEEIAERVVGRVESLEPIDDRRFSAAVSYDPATVAGEIPQLFNLLFGNISLQSGILIESIEWPESLLGRFAGPNHGIEGLRRACGVASPRPLLCAALKPMGLPARQLAAICFDLAAGGVDVIKDDHGLTDQVTAPFLERLGRCAEAVATANARTGRSALYFPNVTGRVDAIEACLEAARAAGCKGVLIAPLLVGPDTVRWIAERFAPVILAHPALAGSLMREDHGLAPRVLLGQLFRLLGSDGVIYPNAGGRFPFTERTCLSINAALREPLGSIAPAFPVPGGGIDVRRAGHWVERYGADTVLLIGGSLYAQPDLVAACREIASRLN